MYYILNEDHEIIQATVQEWAVFFEDGEARRVAFDRFGNGIEVSTVFLGLDHRLGAGSPLLFETMIFYPESNYPQDEYQERYETWDESVAGHARALEYARTWRAHDRG